MILAQRSCPREERSPQDDESNGRIPIKRPHQCGQCPRTYVRKDHLVRHLQSHTARRPFLCSHCRKGFVRKDLLIRHQSIHTVTHPGPVSGSTTFSRRVSKACAPCAAGNVKCDDKKPCRRCQKRGIICSPSLDTDPGTQSPVLPCHLYSTSTDTPRGEINTLGEMEDTEDAFDFSTPSCFTNEEIQSMMIGFESSPDQGSGTMMSMHQETRDSFIDKQKLAIEPLTDTLSGNVITQSLAFQKYYNGWETLIAAGRIKQASRAFKKLPWHQSPLTTDSYARLDKLEGEFWLDEDQYVPPLFDLQARETLLVDLVTVAGRRGWLGLSQSLYDRFPSPGLLDVLVHRFFKQHNRKIDPWIHAPTFRPNLNNLELTSTIVASSAINTPAASLRYVGSIMLKLLRLKISEKIEDQSHVELELQLVQSFLIQLETHLWYGAHLSSIRANTFAEMIRLCTHREFHGRLPENFSESLLTTAEDELPRQWRLWVISESYNRLMTRFCIYDNQSSMTLGTRTSTIISEYHLPLPQPQVLWLAQSPREWRQIYLSSFSRRSLQIRSILPSLSVNIEPEFFLDKDIALKLVFHVIGGLIIDSRESLLSLSARAHLVEVTNEPTSARMRQSELKSAINNFNTVFSKRFCPSSIGSFVVSYLLMTLNASIKDIEILAGKKGEQESWQMYQAMKDWPDTSPAREAIWYAGQILRLFKALDKITSFQVVIVYHAGLVLFAYSALSCTQQQQMVHTRPGLPGLLVNGDSNEERERFISEGFGEPMLLVDCRDNDSASTSLFNTEAVVKIVSRTILDRTCTCEWLSPHVVNSLVKLLTDLGSTVNTFNGDAPSFCGLDSTLSLCHDLNFKFHGECGADSICA